MVDKTKHVLAVPMSKSCRSLRPCSEILVMLLVNPLEGSSACCFFVNPAQDERCRKEKKPLVDRRKFSLVNPSYWSQP